ncbi:MAG: OmpA family protein [Chitinophagaceae bacterium]|jgi:outer membrane protein OmpA-like peptidoglycan-associated protein/tetratricopeptide (TPR) repeat protein
MTTIIRFSISGCFLFLALAVQAQTYNPSKVSKKAQEFYAQAMNRIDDGNWVSAIGLLQKANEADADFADARLTLGTIYSRLKNYKSSAENFEKAFAIDSVYSFDFRVQYATQLAGMGQFEKALHIVNDVLAKKPPKNSGSLTNAMNRQKSFQFAVSFEKNHPVNNYTFKPINLGKEINSSHPEYLPILSIDGSELIFTRRLTGTNEDFYVSKKDSSGWGMAKPAGGNINTPQSEAAQTLSADGEWMIYAASGREDSYGNYDLYMAQKTNEEWEDVYHFGLGINTDQWEAQPSLSPDRKDLYFASRRPGGFGGIDIYVSHLKPNGYYSQPENMGPGINTSGDDQCPFIHADNQTLYFTSNGWLGYGDDDLFVVRKQPNGEWGKPENLGYPINTIEKEGTMCIAADGKTAYYAADRNDSYGGLDIYSFELREDVRPVKTLWVKGKITDKNTGKPVVSTLELNNLATHQTISHIQTDDAGNYFMTLPVGKDYAFNVNSKGYLFYSDNFLMANKSPDSTYIKNILLEPIASNASVVLKNIFFEVNKYELNPESQTELDNLVRLLNENPTMEIEISGHTDNVGKPSDNMVLSNNRAKAVVNFLISKKINPARLVAKGFGETKPLADNKTEAGRLQNRRTEMRVISQ